MACLIGTMEIGAVGDIRVLRFDGDQRTGGQGRIRRRVIRLLAAVSHQLRRSPCREIAILVEFIGVAVPALSLPSHIAECRSAEAARLVAQIMRRGCLRPRPGKGVVVRAACGDVL